jgi:hypothetical protein
MAVFAQGVRREPCAICGDDWRAGATVRAHHVVRQQVIERVVKSRMRGSPAEVIDDEVQALLWDPRNRLDVCDRCHGSHHTGGVNRRRIPLGVVRAKAPRSIEFAAELGREAEAELRREYSDA